MLRGKRIKLGTGVFIAETAIIRDDVEIGEKSRVFDYSIIMEKTKIGRNTTIGTHVCCEFNVQIGNGCTICSLSHLTRGLVIEDRVFAAPMLITTNTRRISFGRNYEVEAAAPVIKSGVRIGGNVVLLPGVVIGEQALIGAGSVVTKDVPAREVWFGNPARKVRDVPKEELLPTI